MNPPRSIADAGACRSVAVLQRRRSDGGGGGGLAGGNAQVVRVVVHHGASAEQLAALPLLVFATGMFNEEDAKCARSRLLDAACGFFLSYSSLSRC